MWTKTYFILLLALLPPFALPLIAEENAISFRKLLDPLRPSGSSHDSVNRATAILNQGDVEEAVELFLELDATSRKNYSELPYTAGFTTYGFPNIFESSANRSLNSLLQTDPHFVEKLSLLQRLFSSDQPENGFYLSSSNLNHLGHSFESSIGSHDLEDIDERIALIESNWQELDQSLRDFAAYAIAAHLSESWDFYSLKELNEAIARIRDLTSSPRLYAPLLAALECMRSHQTWSKDHIAIYDRSDLQDPTSLLTIAKDESVSVPIRSALVCYLTKSSPSLLLDPELAAATVSLYLEATSSKFHSPHHNDIVDLIHELASSSQTYPTLFSGNLGLIPTLLDRMETESDHYPRPQFTGRDLGNILSLCTTAGEAELAVSFAKPFIDDHHRNHPCAIMSLIESGAFELAHDLLPEPNGVLNGFHLRPITPQLLTNFEKFCAEEIDPAVQLLLTTKILDLANYYPGIPKLAEVNREARARATLPLLSELDRLHPLEARRALAAFSRYPSLHPDVAPYLEKFPTRESLVSSYNRNQQEHCFYWGSLHPRLHGLRFASAYAARDWKAAHQLLSEIYSLKDNRGAYYIDDFIEQSISIVTPNFYHDLHHATEKELVEIRDFWRKASVDSLDFLSSFEDLDSQAVLCYSCLADTALDQIEEREDWLASLSSSKRLQLDDDSTSSISPNFTLLRKLFQGDDRYQNSKSGREDRLAVVAEHFTKPAFLKLDAFKNATNQDRHTHLLRDQWIQTLAEDPATPWITSAYFVTNTDLSTEEARTFWLPTIQSLLKQKPTRPTNKFEAQLWEALKSQ